MSFTNNEIPAVIIVIVGVVIMFLGFVAFVRSIDRLRRRSLQLTAGNQFRISTMDKFLNDMEREKPIRFSSQQLMLATDNYNDLLGSGGFGTVYKGIFSDGTIVAVKVLDRSSDKRVEEQFMAEVSTIGRTHHFNLLRLYGFCFERNLRALVYEYMGNGSLEKYLFHENNTLLDHKLDPLWSPNPNPIKLGSKSKTKVQAFYLESSRVW